MGWGVSVGKRNLDFVVFREVFVHTQKDVQYIQPLTPQLKRVHKHKQCGWEVRGHRRCPPCGEGLPDVWMGSAEGTCWEGGLACGPGSLLLDLF